MIQLNWTALIIFVLTATLTAGAVMYQVNQAAPAGELFRLEAKHDSDIRRLDRERDIHLDNIYRSLEEIKRKLD